MRWYHGYVVVLQQSGASSLSHTSWFEDQQDPRGWHQKCHQSLHFRVQDNNWLTHTVVPHHHCTSCIYCTPLQVNAKHSWELCASVSKYKLWWGNLRALSYSQKWSQKSRFCRKCSATLKLKSSEASSQQGQESFECYKMKWTASSR